MTRIELEKYLWSIEPKPISTRTVSPIHADLIDTVKVTTHTKEV
jgi:hypothetical protein